MSKRIERELKSIDTRFLYKPKPKAEMSTEPILLGATKTTELMEGVVEAPVAATAADTEPPSTSRLEDPKPTPPIIDGDGAGHDGGNMVDDQQPGTTEAEVEVKDNFPRTLPYFSVPPSLLSNVNRDEDPVNMSSDGGKANKSSSDENGDWKNGEPKQDGQSVIVNLSHSGSSAKNGKRLSRILDDVQRMREMRRRKNSFDTEGSLNDRMERTKENILRRLDKMKKSKRLLFKYRLYEFLKRPSSICSTIYHVVAFILVMACLIISIAPQMDHHLNDWGGRWLVLDLLEKLVIIWFTVEYLLRLYSCDCRPKYQGYRGLWNFVKAPAHLIDLFVIILSVWVMVWPHEGHEVFAFRAFRSFHRFFQFVQVIITERQLRPWRLFLSVIYDQREQLMVIFYLEIILFSLLAYLGFLVEHQTNDMLDTVAEAVWWSVVTLTTVGYGDKVPIGWRGKLISGAFILFGFCVFALPAGIIGAGLALKLEQVEQTRQRRRTAERAATLIQRAWHAYRDCQSCHQLSSFFGHQPADLYKARVMENISQAFVSLARFHVAKTRFQKLTRGVNLRNVIESYKYGQMDIFARLKDISSNLDRIMTRMAHLEQERIESLQRLTQQLTPGTGDRLVRGRDGTYLINTVSGCFQNSSQPNSTIIQDLTYIPDRKAGGGPGEENFSRDSLRIRSMNPEVENIPYIDYDSNTGTGNDKDENGDPGDSRRRDSTADKRRHSK